MDTTDMNTVISRRIATDVGNDAGRQRGRFISTASTALSTTASQARSAIERTSSTAQCTSKETIGQAKAQSKLTGQAAQRSAAAPTDVAAGAVEPDGERSPPAIDDWSKADLYERAQELAIDGRSSMSKRELVRALRSA